MIYQKETKKTYEQSFDILVKDREDNEMRFLGAMKRNLDGFLERIDKSDEIFEIGSYSGMTADYIESIGYKVIRTDIIDGAIAYNKRKGKSMEYFDILQSNFTQLHKAILAKYVLQHFNRKDISFILKKIYDGLMQGGYFSFTMHAGENVSKVTNKAFKIDLGSSRYMFYMKKSSLDGLLRKLGFHIIQYEYSASKTAYHFYIVQK